MIDYVYLDSLVANEFAVEIDGEPATGVFRVLGFTAYQNDRNQPRQVTVTKMVQRDGSMPFNRWIRDAETQGDAARRDVAIIAVDDGVPVRRWTLKNACIQSVSYSDFDSSSIEMIEEHIKIAYDAVVHEWLAAGN
jgi:phage tail-like protein